MTMTDDRSRDDALVGLVIAAHAPLAGALAESARVVLGTALDTTDAVEIVEIGDRSPAQGALEEVSAAVARADRGTGVLVLADLFGGSAANVALALLGEERVEVVTGANLAMLLDAFSHRADTPLEALAARVAKAARNSVVVAGSLLATTPSAVEPAAADAAAA